MENTYVTLNKENIGQQHLCCAIVDKKHQKGVEVKKNWLMDRFEEGHVFRKLDERGKVFIEYAPLEKAWVPVTGEQYMYIYCLWVAGKFKGKGHGKALLRYCIEDAKQQGKSGVCVISSKKKKPFLSDKKFLISFGFQVVDTIGEDYELLALSFDNTLPRFTESAKRQTIENKELTIYYGQQCPYIPNCLADIKAYCTEHKVALRLIAVDSLEKAKDMPCIFNNWAVFYKGKFETVHLLTEAGLRKILQ
ncbi:MAG: GNAT family N-acetyltransferase [bacterium]|nr:GNAT family N-acetyltransferase [bacterium]